MARRKKRNGAKLYEAKVTPTHHVRLAHLKVEVVKDRRWYVVRIDPRRESRVREGLDKAGFSTCSPAEVALTEDDRGARVQSRMRPLPGYLFAGVEAGQDGRALLWAYHDRIMTTPPPSWIRDVKTGEIYRDRQLGAERRPFFAVLGPFSAAELGRFCAPYSEGMVAVLYEGDMPLAQFPAEAAGLWEGQRLDFCTWNDPGLVANRRAA